MKSIYFIRATSTGGRNGHVTSDYNLIDADVHLPRALGGKDDEHLTPEAFFAAGYAACFNNAVLHIMRLERIKSEPTVVTAKVHLLQAETGFFALAVELIVEIPGIAHDAAVAIVNQAHQICPYSNATRGNIEVKLTVNRQAESQAIHVI